MVKKLASKEIETKIKNMKCPNLIDEFKFIVWTRFNGIDFGFSRTQAGGHVDKLWTKDLFFRY